MHAHVQRRRARKERARDVIASNVVRVTSSVERCRGCRAWRLMTTADVAELERAIAAVKRANAEGYCVWCAGHAERQKRAKEVKRWLAR